jgi:hypothetical protein
MLWARHLTSRLAARSAAPQLAHAPKSVDDSGIFRGLEAVGWYGRPVHHSVGHDCVDGGFDEWFAVYVSIRFGYEVM